jgi:hypothetical protein
MKVTRLYNATDSESHFEEIDIPLRDAGDIGWLSERISANGIIFRETDGDTHYRWHSASNRQFILLSVWAWRCDGYPYAIRVL